MDIEWRWELGVPHDPRSVELYRAISRLDAENGDMLDLRSGGDGDSGERLMYLLDEHFEGLPGRPRALRWFLEAAHHLRCAHHSGIPPCCALVFSLVLQRDTTGWRNRIRRWCADYHAAGDPQPDPDDPNTGPNFIPCPVHRLLRTPWRRLGDCPPGCDHWPTDWWKRT